MAAQSKVVKPEVEQPEVEQPEPSALGRTFAERLDARSKAVKQSKAENKSV